MPDATQSIVADNKANLKNTFILGPGAQINAPITIYGGPEELPVEQLTGGWGPHVEFDRSEQWSPTAEAIAAEGYDCLFLLGARGQAHKQFALRLWGHLVRDPARRIRACMVHWGLHLARDGMRKALARSLELKDDRAIPDDDAVARALQSASADQPLALIHTSIHADEQGPEELADLSWYYREHLPALVGAARGPGERPRQLVVLQPIEWTPGWKNYWKHWRLTPRARILGLIDDLQRKSPSSPFKIYKLPDLEHIPGEERRLLLPDFLKRFDLEGRELDDAVARMMAAQTTQKLFEALELTWRNSQLKRGRRDGRVP